MLHVGVIFGFIFCQFFDSFLLYFLFFFDDLKCIFDIFLIHFGVHFGYSDPSTYHENCCECTKNGFKKTDCCMSWGRLGVVSAPLCGPGKQVKER